MVKERSENNSSKSSKGYIRDDDYDPSFSNYVWNSRTGQFFGRTGMSWAKLTIFYIIFYMCLAAFFICYYWLFDLTLSLAKPKWILDESIIGTNPGMGYRPKPDPDKNAESTLIWYKRSNPDDERFWSKQLSDYIYEVDKPGASEEAVTCNNNGTKANATSCCRVDPLLIGSKACSKASHFGYPTGEPCILLKLNRIFGWEPEGYGIQKDGKYNYDLLVNDLKDYEVPRSIQKYIWDKLNKTKSMTNSEIVGFLSTIWISCEGEGQTDKESIGAVEFHPFPGIPGYYFPYYKQKGYQSPFIFVKLLRPEYGALINVECKAWAKNITPDRTNRLGSVHFEILID